MNRKYQSTAAVDTRLDDVRLPEAATSRCPDCGDNWLDFCLQCEAELLTERTTQTERTAGMIDVDTADSSGQPPRGQNITIVDAFTSMAKVRSR